MVVIIIIGVLSAIALPSFLNQTSKARMSEAKNTVGAVNRGQQAYYMEEGAFTDSMDTLALGLKSDAKNYSYLLSVADGAIVQTENNFDRTKLYSGAVGVDPSAVMRTAICESPEFENAGSRSIAATFADGVPICGGYTELGAADAL